MCCLLSLVTICCAYPSFAISMTVVPNRFSSLEGTLMSWLNQTIPPLKICIFVPNKYRRFKRKNSVKYDLQNSEVLKSMLLSSATMGPHLVNGLIEILGMELDYGPASKFMGFLWYTQYLYSESSVPDFWVVGDDDVGYSNLLLANYCDALTKRSLRCGKNCSNSFGMTQFAETYRQQFRLVKVNADGSTTLEPHRILHVQGVDTFIIPSDVARYTLRYDLVEHIVEYFHSKCPESFYQDDYVISFILHVFNVEMSSIRIDDQLSPTYPIEGVTMFNSQMHIDKRVNQREEATKACVLNSVQYVYSVANVN